MVSKNQTALDTAVYRILTASFETGIWDNPSNGTYFTNVTSSENKNIA